MPERLRALVAVAAVMSVGSLAGRAQSQSAWQTAVGQLSEATCDCRSEICDRCWCLCWCCRCWAGPARATCCWTCDQLLQLLHYRNSHSQVKAAARAKRSTSDRL